MSAPARELLFEKIDAALEAAALAQDGEYEFEPDADPQSFPALHAFDGGDRPVEEETGSDRQALILSVEGYVEGHAGAAARRALNELHAAAIAMLMAEPPLGGLAETITRNGDLRIDTAELAEKRRRGFSQDFEIIYSTVRGDPGQFA